MQGTIEWEHTWAAAGGNTCMDLNGNISEHRYNTNTSSLLYRKGRGNRQVSQWLLAQVMENVTQKEKGNIPNYWLVCQLYPFSTCCLHHLLNSRWDNVISFHDHMWMMKRKVLASQLSQLFDLHVGGSTPLIRDSWWYRKKVAVWMDLMKSSGNAASYVT